MLKGLAEDDEAEIWDISVFDMPARTNLQDLKQRLHLDTSNPEADQKLKLTEPELNDVM